jgi:hypothetical protein
MLHLQEIICGLLDVLANPMTVSGTGQKGSEEEHVKRALNQVCTLLCGFCHGRLSTLDGK